jgi:50S ribosomal protein L16 3-hydroxylase
MTSTRTTPKKSARTSVPAPTAAERLSQPLTLLGGISPQAFMKRYWQKKPLLIRQAVPGVQPPLSRPALFELAGRDDVEARMIVREVASPVASSRSKRAAKPSWSLQQGPIARRSIPKLTQPQWTLLVSGLDLHVPAAHELIKQFRFVPDARLDDVMISYATEGGGVGPHYDSYDVFLLQVHGQRRWRIGPIKNPQLEEGVPLKILSQFEPDQEWVLEPGDMLYLPPMWAHDGIAEGGECMTCSIGFRVPEAGGLAAEILTRVAENIGPEMAQLYRDPGQIACANPGMVPAALQDFAAQAIAKALKDPAQLLSALGEVLTEPKPKVWFDIGEPLPEGAGVVLDARTRMMYDEQRIYANGESWRAAGRDAQVLRKLADLRELTAAEVARASTDVRELLDQWSEDGWLHAG